MTTCRQRASGHRFRFVRSSSSALSPATMESLRALTGAPVVEAYGMTEASHEMASNPLAGPWKAGSVGVPTAAEVAVIDASGRRLAAGEQGEIVIRGRAVTAGYEHNAGANAEAWREGWSRTGDQGRFDADGYLYLTGRLKEIVNRGAAHAAGAPPGAPAGTGHQRLMSTLPFSASGCSAAGSRLPTKQRSTSFRMGT